MDKIHVMYFDSCMGQIITGTTDKGICLIEFYEKGCLESVFADVQSACNMAIVHKTHPFLRILKKELGLYFSNKLSKFSLPLHQVGTDFQLQVWNTLIKIPYGQVKTYGQVADMLSNPKACRAVGTANGRNRIPILVPCHRVIGSHNTIGGYSGGLWRKQLLLELEGHCINPKGKKLVS